MAGLWKWPAFLEPNFLPTPETDMSNTLKPYHTSYGAAARLELIPVPLSHGIGGPAGILIGADAGGTWVKSLKLLVGAVGLEPTAR
jgi:hypothetical protein